MKVPYKNFILNKSRVKNSENTQIYTIKRVSDKFFLQFPNYNYRKTHDLLKKLNFFNPYYSKLPSLCNKQGRFKRSFNSIFLNRHVLLKHVRGGSGYNLVKTLTKKKW